MQDKTSRLVIGSAVAGALTSAMITPIEHARIKMTTNDGSLYKGSIDACIKIFRFHRFKGLQRGYVLTALRETFYFICFFGVYESVKSVFDPIGMNGLGRSLGSSAAGPLSWLLIFPLDTVKTIVQSDSLSKPEWTVRSYLGYLRKKKATMSLFNGVSSVMVRSIATGFIFFNIWEISLNYIIHLEDTYGY